MTDYDPMIATRTIREHCRRGLGLDGADAQAMEHALTITEQERDEASAEIASLRRTLVLEMDARRAADLLIERWKRASGLMLGGDPDAVTPEHLEAYLGQLYALATGSDLPTVHLTVDGDGFRSIGDNSPGWSITARYIDDTSAVVKVALLGERIAEVTVHCRPGESIADEAQAIGAALLWSAMRAEQIKALPTEVP